MFEKHKQPSLEAGLLIVDKVDNFTQLGKISNFPVILVVISIFSIGFLGEGKVSGIFGKEEGLERITGNMVKVRRMEIR